MSNGVMNFGVNLNMFVNPNQANQGMNGFLNQFQNKLNGISKSVMNSFKNMNFGGFFGGMKGIFSTLNGGVNSVIHSVFNLKTALFGLLGATGLGAFGHSLLHTATELEGVYARLMTVFGSATRVKEHFRAARKFEMENPMFSIDEIHESVANLAMNGMAKTSKQADRNLRYIADFAAGKRITNGAAGATAIDLTRATQIVAQASMSGSFQRLSNLGITQAGLPTIAKNAMGSFTDLDDGKNKKRNEELTKLLPSLAAAKKGTKEYGEALIKFLGIMESGAAEKMSRTIAGSLSSLHNIYNYFKLDLVGVSQEVGTFSNAVSVTLSKQVNKLRELAPSFERIAHGMGGLFKTIWSSVDGFLDKTTNKFVDFIKATDAWFSDWKNKVAPFIVFMYLIKIRVMDFLTGFKKGFLDTMGKFWDVVSPVLTFFGKLFGIIGDSKNMINMEKLGDRLGTITALLLSWKLVAPVVSSVGSALGGLGKIGSGLAQMFAPNFLSKKIQDMTAKAALATGEYTYVWVLNMPGSGLGGIGGGLGGVTGTGAGAAGARGLLSSAMSYATNPYVLAALATAVAGFMTYKWYDNKYGTGKDIRDESQQWFQNYLKDHPEIPVNQFGEKDAARNKGSDVSINEDMILENGQFRQMTAQEKQARAKRAAEINDPFSNFRVLPVSKGASPAANSDNKGTVTIQKVDVNFLLPSGTQLNTTSAKEHAEQTARYLREMHKQGGN